MTSDEKGWMQLPSGTVTFLITDIEGSTRLWEHQPDAMRAALARHDALLRQSIQQQGGALVKTTGDGIHAAFASAPQAALAALAAQRALIGERWDEAVGRLPVRMALHTGTAELRDGDYYGPAINRTARLLSAGHGEQILLSSTTQKLVRDELPENVILTYLGRYRLPDLVWPEHVYQLSAPGLRDRFPPLLTLDTPHTNLPKPPTPFLGREEELGAVMALLRRKDVQLVTLSGPGGAGKTRLALQVAIKLQADFKDGVVFVDLALVTDPNLFASTIAHALGVRESSEHSLKELLAQHLSNKEVLLLLDNLEQLMAGAEIELLSDILAAAPAVKLLATSRELLNLREEWLYPVEGMPIPQEADSGRSVKGNSAVQLFETCAQRVRPTFSLDDEVDDVIRICRLVEGMPLAIELAAAWTKSLSCAEIVDEITRDIDFLVTSLRNIPERHRSMQAVFHQSWKLLDEKERDTLKRLSVFRGGFDRSAAGRVADVPLTILSSLVDKSILLRGTAGRYQLHRLLRQYAEEQLAPDEYNHSRELHCQVYADFLDARLPEMLGARQLGAMAEIGAELENIRTAWSWSVEHANAEALFKSAETLARFYEFQNRYQEALSALEAAAQSLSSEPGQEQTDLALIRVRFNLAWIYIRLGQLQKAEDAGKQCRELYRRLGIRPIVGQGSDPSLIFGILALIRGEYAKAARLGEEVCRASEEDEHLWNRQLGYYVLAQASLGLGDYQVAQTYAQAAYETTERTRDRWFMAYCLNDLGTVALAKQDFAGARRFYEAGYALREEFNDPEGMAVALNRLGEVAIRQQRFVEAQTLYQQSLEIYEQIGDRGGLATSLYGSANAAAAMGDLATARIRYREALHIAADIHYLPLVLNLLIGIGNLLQQIGQKERCVELLALVADHPAGEEETKSRARQILDRCHVILAPGQFDSAVERGQKMDLETATAFLLAELVKPLEAASAGSQVVSPSTAESANEALADPLTPRELEVLQLIANGLSNRQIAEELVIALGTVKSYTSEIYSKLHVTSRTQAVARARELNLIGS